MFPSSSTCSSSPASTSFSPAPISQASSFCSACSQHRVIKLATPFHIDWQISRQAPRGALSRRAAPNRSCMHATTMHAVRNKATKKLVLTSASSSFSTSDSDSASAKLSTAIAKKTFSRMSVRWQSGLLSLAQNLIIFSDAKSARRESMQTSFVRVAGSRFVQVHTLSRVYWFLQHVE